VETKNHRGILSSFLFCLLHCIEHNNKHEIIGIKYFYEIPNQQTNGGGHWYDNFLVEGEFSGGVQGGFNLNNAARLNLNIASTPIFGFKLGKENKIDYPGRYKNALTIKQSASIGAVGVSTAWEREFLGHNVGGSTDLTDKFTTTYPIIPFILSGFEEIVTGPDGQISTHGGLTVEISGSLIIGGSLSIKYYRD
jgi:hypothetical protein